MAIAPIEMTLPGLKSFTDIVLDLSAQGVYTPTVTGLVLTFQAGSPSTYVTSTTAGLTGIYLAKARNAASTIEYGVGEVVMDDTTANHIVGSSVVVADWLDGGRLDLLLDAIKTKTDALPLSVWTTALTEAYRATGAAGTAAQLMHEILQNLTEFAIVSTTKTVKKFDGATTAKTYTLDSATAPTAITEAT